MAADDDYNMLNELADRLELDDKQKESFIGSAMSRLGYKAKQLWEDFVDDGGDGGNGDFFGRGRSVRNIEPRGRQGRGERPRRESGGGMFG